MGEVHNNAEWAREWADMIENMPLVNSANWQWLIEA